MRVAYTPGHASHHVCYLHEESGTAFVGDVAACRIPPSSLIMPPTPPPDIDVETWEDSLGPGRGLAPQRLALTHFGAIEDDVPAYLDAVRGAPARRGRAGPRDARGGLRAPTSSAASARELAAEGLDGETVDELIQAVPTAYQWRGLDRYWRKSSRARRPPRLARCSRIRSTASSMRSSGAVRAMRKKPSPLGPYIEPGEMTTAASSSTSSQKEVEVWPSGTGAQT